jgi:hypothetical protein
MVPFFVGCHSAVTTGKRAASELVIETFCPMQHGHPVGLFFFVRLAGEDSHSWSGPSGHRHHTLLQDPAGTWSGVMSPFLVGCHSAATIGKRVARELVMDALRPKQQGQPLPPRVRLLSDAGHSWSRPLGQSHQTDLLDPATTCSGFRLPFLVGCHSRARYGKRAASELVTEAFFPPQNGQPVPGDRSATRALHS